VATVRRIASELRPLMLDDLGLNAALDWLARDSTRRLGLAIALQLDDVDPPLGERASISVYRMLQEVLAHIASHSRATDVSVELRRDAGELRLMVLDNDNGVRESTSPGEPVAGTLGLRQHARLLGGEMIIDEMPGSGRRFMLRLPLPGEAGAGARASVQGAP
jgi:two-component system sensor histidine kinase UhpB